MSAEDCIEWQNRFVMNGELEWVLKDAAEQGEAENHDG